MIFKNDILIIFPDGSISGLSSLAVSQEIDCLNKFHLFIRYLLLFMRKIQKV